MSPSSLTLFLSLMLLCTLASVHAQLKVFNLRANGLPSGLLGTTDGYVKVYCGPEYLGKTRVRYNSPHPWWSEEFDYFNAQQNNMLKLEVFDSDVLFDDKLGTCERRIMTGTHQHECYLKRGGTLYYTYTLQ